MASFGNSPEWSLGLELVGHNHAVRSLCWSPDGSQLASAGDDNVRVWDVVSGAAVHILDSGPVWSVRWSPDGLRLATVSHSGNRFSYAGQDAAVWDVVSGERVLVLEGVGSACEWSPDSSQLAWSGRLWDAMSGACVLVLETAENSYPEERFLWSPDGSSLARADGVNEVRVWDAVSGACVLVFPSRTGSVRWSPDGSQLAFDARVWDLAQRAWVFAVERGIGAPSWSPDGSRLVCEVAGRGPAMYDAVSGAFLHVLKDKPAIGGVLWSPDGKRLAGTDGTKVQVWDAVSGVCVIVLEDHFKQELRETRALGEKGTKLFNVTKKVLSVRWSPDGSRLATAGEDQTVRVWNRTMNQGEFNVEPRGVDNVELVGESLRFQILQRDRLCQLCGAGPNDEVLEIDHIVPRSKGGSNEPSNLQVLCARCSRGKNNSTNA